MGEGRGWSRVPGLLHPTVSALQSEDVAPRNGARTGSEDLGVSQSVHDLLHNGAKALCEPSRVSS